MGGTAYQAATLDRALAELALADVGGALWHAHAQQWARLTRPWSDGAGEPRWLRWALYVDATQDPYWTRFFAASGKVSRVGRVMPRVTRVALMGGPGVPLWIETRAARSARPRRPAGTPAALAAPIDDGRHNRAT